MRPTARLAPSDAALGQASGRWVLATTVLGSGLVLVDGTLVNIALPQIGEDLGASLQSLTWVVNSFALALAALVLFGGSLADRFGRRRVFVIGVAWFAVASAGCALAPNVESLIAARTLQGIGGALVTPGSLAIIQSSFSDPDRSRAIGAWAALASLTGAGSPLLGGWLLMVASWRWLFLINVPLAVVVLLAARHVPESHSDRRRPLDLPGTVLAAAGLAAVTYGLSSWGTAPSATTEALRWLLVGSCFLGGFVLWERRTPAPLVSATLLRSRLFASVNSVTLLLYAAFGGVLFWVVIQLQVVGGFTALQSGLALLPVTALTVAFSVRASAWGHRIGPRLPLQLGPLIASCGVTWLAGVGAGASYWVDVLPGMFLFAVGLVLTVGPLTVAALVSAPASELGIASGVNNTVARVGGLLAVAGLPALSGLTTSYTDVPALTRAYPLVMLICAALLAAAAVLAWATIPGGPACSDGVRRRSGTATTDPRRPAVHPGGTGGRHGREKLTPLLASWIADRPRRSADDDWNRDPRARPGP